MRARLTAVFLCALSASAALADDAISPAVMQQIKSATVFVRVKIGELDLSGTGFVFHDQAGQVLVATNNHVVDFQATLALALASDELSAERRTVLETIRKKLESQTTSVTAVFNSGTPQEQGLPAEIVANDPEHDLAVLKVVGLTTVPKPIAFIAANQTIETMNVFVFGFPFGVALSANKANPTISVGKGAVSSLRLDDAGELSLVQINGAINPGNSGGPVVTAEGQLVGVAVSTVVGAGLGFAIPAAELAKMLEGRASAWDAKVTRQAGGTVDIDLTVRLVDPLQRIKSVGFGYLPGEPSAKLLAPSKNPPALPGSQQVAVQRQGAVATGKFTMPAVENATVVLTGQANYIDAAGKPVNATPRVFKHDPRQAVVVKSNDVPQDGRMLYQFRQREGIGWYRWTPAGWSEELGQRRRTFEETERTHDAVVLYDATRNIYVKLLSDHAEFKFGEGKWNRMCPGVWQKATVINRAKTP